MFPRCWTYASDVDDRPEDASIATTMIAFLISMASSDHITNRPDNAVKLPVLRMGGWFERIKELSTFRLGKAPRQRASGGAVIAPQRNAWITSKAEETAGEQERQAGPTSAATLR
jgi:hypothetical protein